MALPYLEAVLCFMFVTYIFETYLDIRQHRALKLPTLPRTLVGVISEEKFQQSRAYSLDKSAILYYKVLTWFWKKSGEAATNIGLNAENEIIHTLSFLAGVMVWSQQTIWLFITDMIKGILLSILLGPPFVAAIIIIVQKGGPLLAIYLWGLMFALSLVMMTLYPILIAPLFNKFTPLPEGALTEKIEKLAASLKFPLKKLLVVDGSIRSSHSNAYMYGFFKNKHVVLYDTLIQQPHMFMQFGGYALIRNLKDLFESFGFKDQPIIIGLIIFQHTIIPVQHLLSFCLNLVSRAFEFQADAFAKKLGYVPSFEQPLLNYRKRTYPQGIQIHGIQPIFTPICRLLNNFLPLKSQTIKKKTNKRRQS